MRGMRPLAALMVGVAALGLFALWQRRLHPPLTGDEPGYVVVAESLWFDHDTNLVNNFGANARIHTALLNPVGPAASIRLDSPTDWRPTQPLGMGLLLTPAVAIGHRGAAELQWARRLMILVAALLVWQIFELLAEQVGWALAVVITGGVALAFPLVGYSNQAYPEIPAALLLTVGLRGVLAQRRPHPILVGLAAAGLPWLSMRYLPLAVGLVVALASRSKPTTGSSRFRPVVIAGAVLALGLLVMLAVDPVSVLHAPSPVPQSAINTYRIGVGGLFSPVFGLLPYAPQLALGVVGLGLVARMQRSAGAAIVIGAVAYEFAAIPFGFRGDALPARFQIVLIPLLALGAALLVQAYPRIVAVFAAATVFGAVALVQAGSQPTYGLLYRDPPRPALPVLKPVARVLPGFALAPGHTGATFPGSQLDRAAPVPLRRGTYALSVRAGPESFANARVVVSSNASGSMRPVVDVTRPLSPDGTLALPFAVEHSGVAYQFRVAAFAGAVTGDVESLTVRLTGNGESRTAPSQRDVPLGLVWLLPTIGLTVVAAVRGGERLDRRGKGSDDEASNASMVSSSSP